MVYKGSTQLCYSNAHAICTGAIHCEWYPNAHLNFPYTLLAIQNELLFLYLAQLTFTLLSEQSLFLYQINPNAEKPKI